MASSGLKWLMMKPYRSPCFSNLPYRHYQARRLPYNRMIVPISRDKLPQDENFNNDIDAIRKDVNQDHLHQLQICRPLYLDIAFTDGRIQSDTQDVRGHLSLCVVSGLNRKPGDDQSETCRACQKTGDVCERTASKIRFRHGSSAKYDSLFGNDQVWLRIFDFVDESDEVIASYNRDSGSDGDGDYSTENHGKSLSPAANRLSESASSVDYPRHCTRVSLGSDGLVHASPVESGPLSLHASAYPQDQRPFSPNISTDYQPQRYGGCYDEPGLTSESFHTHQPNIHQLTSSLPTNIGEDHVTLRLEATLLRYFIEEICPWFDICDPDRHFARVLPHRARNCPPLLQAILTASARHLTTSLKFKSPTGGYTWNGLVIPNLNKSTALHYHDNCIRSLLSLSGDLSRINSEDLLAAAIVLRFYEEIDSPLENNTDKGVLLRVLKIFVNAQLPSPDAFPCSLVETYHKHHHHHFSLVSNTSPTTPPAITHTQSTTLLRACLSIAFRQELYKSFMTQRPFTLPLSRWSSLRSFTPAGDGTWADRLVLFCADVLEYCYGSSETDHLPSTDVNRWNDLTRYAEDLHAHLPPCFEPIYTRSPLESSGDVFPEIWYGDGCHATAISHLHLAKMLLAVFNPTIPKLGHGHMAAMMQVRAVMRETVMKLCGIALWNRRAPSVLVDATMAIKACGECITEPSERQAVLGLLRVTEVEYAWPTGGIAQSLKEAWEG
ncbi:hypothetical protein BDV27DRAFT_157314 [Aspergillus caelatus]|uniref:ARCA protein n=1 Tax=Aspergillus caelatus TaxID=61420 RepID=A0A5N7A725_9EURO|nr:uncharacterized protein BDV27DRAFT_157314 [Aspergillus caelatus]KAE8365016.1 hypothetical protein BDV27DRAFT_157314 [Aspergillus caelatus]